MCKRTAFTFSVACMFRLFICCSNPASRSTTGITGAGKPRFLVHLIVEVSLVKFDKGRVTPWEGERRRRGLGRRPAEAEDGGRTGGYVGRGR